MMVACLSPADNNYEEVDDQYDEYTLIIECMEKKSFKCMQTVMEMANIVEILNRLVDKYSSDTNYI